MRRMLITVAVVAAALAVAPTALATGGPKQGSGSTANPAYSLEGAAVKRSGHVELVSDLSDAATGNDASWIDFDVKAGLTFAQLTSLSAEFNVTDDGCGGGSPRFQINVGGKNVFVYLGPSPSFTGCSLNTWTSSGNLVGTSDACRVDTSQLSPGTQCSTWAAAVALLGTQAVTGIQLVVDAGWFFADKEQTVLVRNVVINGKTYVTDMPGSMPSNPSKACKQQRQLVGSSAFGALWGTSTAKGRNAHGKCVSYLAKLSKKGSLGAFQQELVAAVTTCRAQGFEDRRLGRCVAERIDLPSQNERKGKKHKKDRDD